MVKMMLKANGGLVGATMEVGLTNDSSDEVMLSLCEMLEKAAGNCNSQKKPTRKCRVM